MVYNVIGNIHVWTSFANTHVSVIKIQQILSLNFHNDARTDSGNTDDIHFALLTNTDASVFKHNNIN